MKGTWGRRVFGYVHRGRTHTRFYLEYELTNGVPIFSVTIQPNEEIDRYPDLYKWILNNMVEELDKRIAERAQ